MNSILKYIPDIRPKGAPSVHNFGNPDDLYNALENANFHDISIRKYTFLYKDWYSMMSTGPTICHPLPIQYVQ